MIFNTFYIEDNAISRNCDPVWQYIENHSKTRRKQDFLVGGISFVASGVVAENWGVYQSSQVIEPRIFQSAESWDKHTRMEFKLNPGFELQRLHPAMELSPI